jgi:hypothetical protein
MKEWRCFHCDEVFTNPKHAAAHFGIDQLQDPGCVQKLTGGEDHLLTEILRLRTEMLGHWDEDSRVMQWSRAKVSEVEAKIPAAEQTGYDKGVADCRAQMREAYDLLKSAREGWFPEDWRTKADEWIRKHGEPT